MEHWHILIVEDDPDGQELVTRIFEHYHVPCKAVGTAEEALVLIEHQAYTGCVIDLALPQMDGWQLLKAIHQQNEGLPCVAMTAYHSLEVAYKARQAGFAEYFSKPIDAKTFLDRLRIAFEHG